MSTALTPSNVPLTPPAPTSPSSAAPSTTPSGSAPSTSAPTGPTASPEFRFGDDVESWARGKTAKEVLGIASKLAEVVQNAQAAPAPQASTQPATAGSPMLGNDDYVTGGALQQYGQKMMDERFRPEMEGLYRMTGDANLYQVQQANQSIFQKYGPEVYAKLATVPRNMWTVDNIKTVVNLVKADHVDDLVREGALRVAAEMEPALRSTGASAVPVNQNQPDLSLKSERLPASYRDRLANAGVTEAVMDEFLRANDGMTREAFIQMVEKTAITETPRRG